VLITRQFLILIWMDMTIFRLRRLNALIKKWKNHS
jgi:hypothetical protein